MFHLNPLSYVTLEYAMFIYIKYSMFHLNPLSYVTLEYAMFRY